MTRPHLLRARRRSRSPRWRPAGRSPYVARLWALVIITGLVVTALVGRLAQLQVADGRSMRAASQQINTRSEPIPAARGQILDAAGQALVANGSSEELTIDPTVLADSADGGKALIEAAARVVGGNAAQMLARTKACGTTGAAAPPICFSGNAFEPIPIMQDVSPTKAIALLEQPEAFPGMAIQSVPVLRFPAPDGVNAAQLLGYVGDVNSADLKANSALNPDDQIGRAGLELQYDAQLRGTDGVSTVAVDARGLPVREVSRTAPIGGEDIVTHLSAPVQARVESALAGQISALRAAKQPVTGGAALVLDASDGAVVASASYPTYSPSIWSGGISQTSYDALTEPSANDPLLNRVIGQLQPPASTFKGITLPAAITAGVNPSGTYDCTSQLDVDGQIFHNSESQGWGPISMTKALEVSCDTVFYRWALAQWNKQGGLNATTEAPDPFTQMAAAFHIGQRTGVDLPGEASGLLQSRQWKYDNWLATRTQSCRLAKTGYPTMTDRAQAKYLTALAQQNCTDGYLYQPGDAVNFVIGQGATLVTPLQMGVVYAALANGGTLWTPQVVAAVEKPDGSDRRDIPAVAAGHVTIPAVASSIEAQGFRDVIAQPDGTAYQAFRGFPLASYPLWGKTGTGEVYGKAPTAWFVSYGPKVAGGHQYVVVVMVEQGGFGADAAAPVARQIWDLLRTQN